jgi:heptosyltransferase-2
MPRRRRNGEKLLIVLPNWVGDAVMAGPVLRALRQLYPDAHITGLARRYVKDVFAGMPWLDRLVSYRTGKTEARAGKGRVFRLAARLRSARFDTAVVLTNSFASALVCKLARIQRIIGYDRDGRGFLLTDRLLPPRERGKFIPLPLVRYYLGISSYLGSGVRDGRLELFVTEADRHEARQVLERAGLEADVHRPGAAGGAPLVMLNPGAQYGQAKCWPPEYFAQLADRLIGELGATVLVSGSPRERAIAQAVQRHTRHALVDLTAKGLTLGALKDVVRRCDLMITNDTGPRHVAAAMDVPVVTIFGPTHPQWTEIDYAKERKAMVKVFCGPCQKKVCPLDRRCLTQLTPAMVWEKTAELLGQPVASERSAR